MKKISLKKLKTKRYLAGVLIIALMVGLLGLFKIANIDKLKGTIKINNAHLVNVATKLNANIYDLTEDNAVESNGYDQVDYTVKYSLSESTENRDVLITATLPDTEQYATFKKSTGRNVTSVLSNGGKQIDITISNVESGQEITSVISMLVSGAPNNYTITPNIKIKESTSDTYTDIVTRTVTVKTNSLTGIVRDYDNNPVDNILVGLYQNGTQIKEAYTDENGRYTFSGIAQGEYKVEINEDIYDKVEQSNVNVQGNTSLNLLVNRVYPFEIKTHKYITKVDLNNNGIPSSRSYNDLSLVQIPVENLGLLKGKVYYKIVVENTGEKEGIVTLVKDELPEFMSFDEKLNSGFEIKNGYIYDRNLEGITLSPGEKKTDVLILNIEDTKEAKRYLNRVTAYGEIYDHVTYLLDGEVYKEEDVLEGETITEAITGIDGFKGWFTDEKLTNKYKFNNPVIKDLILYGKTNEKYNVEFYDKDPENGDEDLYHEEEVNGGDTVDKPTPDPTHTGYTFEHWCTEDLEEYNFSTPVTSDLKLITCYKINEYDVNFYNYEDTKEKTIKVEYKHTIDQTEAPTFDETGYTFTCWTDNKQTKECFDFTTPITKEVNLYPQHEIIENAVIFNDENRITTVNVEYAQTVDPIADQGKEGHTFRCWSEDRENCFDFTTPIIKTTTVYAVYDINKFTVSFFDKDPETEIETQYSEPQTINYKGKATKPTPDPTHTGYTFNSWIKEDGTTYDFDTEVTENIKLITKYDINSYPVRFHDGDTVTEKNVKYKNLVTPIENPTKEHNIFLGWTKDNELFDFNTPIVEETDLYSSYEEVKAPTVSHVPTEWTNQNVLVTISKPNDVEDATGYSYKYKVDDGEYLDYGDPFVIEENCIIIAKSIKNDVGSELTEHPITNIDKINPTINYTSIVGITQSTATFNFKTIDHESGMSKVKIYLDNVLVNEKNYTNDFNNEKSSNYQFTGLEQETDYVAKIEAFDRAGNMTSSEEIPFTTTTPDYVCQLIANNNIPLSEDNYIKFMTLKEAFDYGKNSEDLYDCQTTQCTIQMLRSVNESNVILSTQNLTLDLNGTTITGVLPDYVFENNGKFQVIDHNASEELTGTITNLNEEVKNGAGELTQASTGIYNKIDATLTIGEGSTEINEGAIVSVTEPLIFGRSYGIYNESNDDNESGILNFFDGKIKGDSGVQGEVTATEYLYNANAGVEDEYETITLAKNSEAVARKNKSKYYSLLPSAILDTKSGTYSEEDSIENIMASLGTTDSASKTGYIYDEDAKTLSTPNADPASIVKTSTIISTKNYENEQFFVINYKMQADSKGNNPNIVTKVILLDEYGRQTSTNIYPTSQKYDGSDGIIVYKLAPGQKYSLELKYTMPTVAITELEDYTPSKITITNMKLIENDSSLATVQINKTEDTNFTEYGFYYDEDTDTIRSNSQYVINPDNSSTIAYSYIELDLTNKEGQYDLFVTTSLEYFYSRNIYSYAWVQVDESPSMQSWPSYSDCLFNYTSTSNNEDGVYSYNDEGFFGKIGPIDAQQTLEGGKKYYLKFKLLKSVNSYNNSYVPTTQDYIDHNNSDQLIINSIKLIKKSETEESLPISTAEKVENLTETLANNSEGSFTYDSNTEYMTSHISSPGETAVTQYTFDLTNEEKIKDSMLRIKYKITKDSNDRQGYLDYYQDSKVTCNINGETISSSLNSVESYSDEEGYGYYGFALTPNCKTDLVLSFKSTSGDDLTEFSNIEMTVTRENMTGFKGNYFNALSKWNNNSNYQVQSSWIVNGEFNDSYYKIDLSDKDKDQMLRINAAMYSNSAYKSFIYLTNNNKGLTFNELMNNRDGSILYMSQGSYPYRNKQSYYPSQDNSPYYVYLPKGNVYYLHFARDAHTTNISGTYSFRVGGLTLIPVEENILSMGNTTVFTGTETLTQDEDESYTYNDNISMSDFIIHNEKIYGFTYHEDTDTYTNDNAGIPNSKASRVFTFDLTNETTKKIFSITRSNISFSQGKDAYLFKNEIPKSIISTTYNDYYPKVEYSFDPSYFELEPGNIYYIQLINTYSGEGWFKINEISGERKDDYVKTTTDVTRLNSDDVDDVQLLKDIVLDEGLNIPYTKEVKLDLNGHKITTNSDEFRESTVITNEGKLTIEDTEYTNQIEDPAILNQPQIDEYNELVQSTKEKLNSGKVLTTKEFDYNGTTGANGSIQTFTVPEDGEYILEAWGAQGSNAHNTTQNEYYGVGGFGGYSRGIISLSKDQVLYIGVGGTRGDIDKTSGTQYLDGGYNGGGASRYSNDVAWTPGGGATHIATVNGLLKNLSSNKEQILIVAGGGGGAGRNSNGFCAAGGSAGGFKGSAGVSGLVNGTSNGLGGTQTAGGNVNGSNYSTWNSDYVGQFGLGAGNKYNNRTGGGGGWYGGGVGMQAGSGAGGGSGYIGNELLTNKVMYCYECSESPLYSEYTISTTARNSTAYANTPKRINGYAKISYWVDAEDDTQTSTAYTDETTREYLANFGIHSISTIYDREYEHNGVITSSTTNSIILNKEKAKLMVNEGALYTGKDNQKVIENYGELASGSLSIIEVRNPYSYGIYNRETGKIVTGGMEIKLNPYSDYSSRSKSIQPYSVGIYITDGSNVEFSGWTITGANGTGLYVENGGTARITGTSYNITNPDEFYYYDGRNSGFVEDLDAAVTNYGNTYLVGTFNDRVYNFKSMETGGVTIKKLVQYSGNGLYRNFSINDAIIKDGDAIMESGSIYNTLTNYGKIKARSGAAYGNVTNYGDIDTKYVGYTSINNLITLNTTENNADQSVTRVPTLIAEYGSANGCVINEGDMNLSYFSHTNGGTCEAAITNRGNLTLREGTTLNSPSSPEFDYAIYNDPYTYNKMVSESDGTKNYKVYRKTTVTIGEDDGNVVISNGPYPSIYGKVAAITGKCYQDTGLMESDQLYSNIDEREKVEALCSLNYYDGVITTPNASDIKQVVDIPIKNIPTGYEVSGTTSSMTLRKDNENGGFARIDSTVYPSIKTALDAVPTDNTKVTIHIMGSFSSAEKVHILENQNVVLNYSDGSNIISYSEDPLITVDAGGTLEVTSEGSGLATVVGLFLYENNGTLIINGSKVDNGIGQYYKRSFLVRNNATTTINDITSHDIDSLNLSNGTLNITNGSYTANTIHSDGGEVNVTGGYFEGEENSNFTFKYKNASTAEIKEINTNIKHLFNGYNDATVNFSNVDNTTDTRYNNIAIEQALGKFDNSSLVLTNNKYGGKQDRSLYVLALDHSDVIVNSGIYDKFYFDIGSSTISSDSSHPSTFTMNDGTIKSNDVGIYLNGNGTELTVKKGTIYAGGTGILVSNSNATTITLGTKIGTEEDGVVDDECHKDNPNIFGSTFGITSGGLSFANGGLYWYDGILRSNGNPLDISVTEVETDYTIKSSTEGSEKQRYLFKEPKIINNTKSEATGTDVTYYSYQEAFDDAGDGDILTTLVDYTNTETSQPIIIPSTAHFTLNIENKIIANNANQKDENDEVIPNPFIINNGNVIINGSTEYNSNNEDMVPLEFTVISDATLIENNGTLSLNNLGIMANKLNGIVLNNNIDSTLNMTATDITVLQKTAINNNGTLNVIRSSSESDECYNPSHIYSKYLEVLKLDSDGNDNIEIFCSQHSQAITNNGIANIGYLNIIAENLCSQINNTGDMTLSYVVIDESVGNDHEYNLASDSLGQSLINNDGGQLTVSDSKFYRIPNRMYYRDVSDYTRRYYHFKDHKYDSGIGSTIYNLTTNEKPLKISNTFIDAGPGNAISSNTALEIEGSEIYTGINGVRIQGSPDYVKLKDSKIYSNAGVVNGLNYSLGGYSISYNNFNYYQLYNINLDVDGGDYKSKGLLSAYDKYEQNLTTKYINSCENNSANEVLVNKESTNTSTRNDGGYSMYIPMPIFIGNNINIKNATVTEEFSGSYSNQTNNFWFSFSNLPIYDGGSGNNKYSYPTTFLAEIMSNDDINIENSTINNSYNSFPTIKTLGHLNLGSKDGVVNDSLPSINGTVGNMIKGKVNLYDGIISSSASLGETGDLFDDIEDGYRITGSDKTRYLTREPIIKNTSLDDNNEYTSFEDALNDTRFENGNTLQLINSYALRTSEAINITGNNFILDLNGNYLDGTITLDSTSEITVKNNSADNTTLSKIVNNGGKVIIEKGVKNIDSTNGTVTIGQDVTDLTVNLYENAKAIVNGNCTLNAYNNSEVTINTTGAFTITMNDDSIVNVNDGGGSLTLKGNSTMNYINSTNITLRNHTNKNYTINSGTLSSIENYNIDSTFTISGITVRSIINIGTAHITSSTITGQLQNGYSYSLSGYGSDIGSATMTVSDSTIKEFDNYGNANANIDNCTIRQVKTNIRQIYNSDTSDYDIYSSGITTINNSVISNDSDDTIINRTNLVLIDSNVYQTSQYSPNSWSHYTSIRNTGTLTIGTTGDGVDITTPIIQSSGYYGIVNEGTGNVYFYDGVIIGNSNFEAKSGYIRNLEPGYKLSNIVDDSTSIDKIFLTEISEESPLIAMVNNINYPSLQDAINKSVKTCSDSNACPEVTIYANLELDADLVITSGYKTVINLNGYKISDNGYSIDPNITFRDNNGNEVDHSGNPLGSSLSRFLADILSSNGVSKNVIIYQMEDGNKLDTSKTYKLYVYDNNIYRPAKVTQDEEVGKYKLGDDDDVIRPIKGRVYLNDLSKGDYKLVDNTGTEVDFSIGENGELSSNIKEYVKTNYGRLMASGVAELIITIQTGITRYNYLLIGLTIIIGIIILMLLSKKNKSLKNKETI